MIPCAVISNATKALAIAFLAGLATPAAAGCASDTFEDVPFTYCTVDPANDDIRLFHIAPDGQIFGTFDRVNAALNAEGRKLGLAMNGGMYHDDRSPVGLYVENGVESMRLVTSAGPGNFGLVPNGVLCLAHTTARVIETTAYAAENPTCIYASQTGPMLVIGGNLHPKFLENSTSSFIRNGVGTRPDGALILAISDAPVTFHRFARLMRDRLGTPDALYIDGNVSRLYAPDLGRHDIGFPMGPILGTVIPAD